MTTNDRERHTREVRCRRQAKRNGLRLMKSRRQKPTQDDRGGYVLYDVHTGQAKCGAMQNTAFTATLDDIERFLTDNGTENEQTND